MFEEQGILHSIRNANHSRVRQVEAEAQQQLNQIHESAHSEADAQRQRILTDGQAYLSRQQALIEQQALMRALQIHADARLSLVERALQEAWKSLQDLRTQADYKRIFAQLVQQALDAVRPSRLNGQAIILHIDPRDKALADQLLKPLTDPPQVAADLDCLGGCYAETEDHLVMVKNTIDSRYEHALPFIRQELGNFFENRISNG